MDTLAVVLRGARAPRAQPARPRRRRRRTTSSSTSSGAASAPAPSGCSGPAACRPSRAWAIRWSPATSRSAASPRPGRAPGARVGERVFVPGARCFGEVRGLFGGAAVPRRRAGRAGRAGRRAARRAGRPAGAGRDRPPRDRRRARQARSDRRPRRARPAAGAARRARRRRAAGRLGAQSRPRATAATATASSIPTDDARRDYRAIYDVSGDAGLLDTLIARLAPGGEVVLAGFYSEPLSLRLPAGLHARGAHPRRRRVAATPISPPVKELVETGRAVARRPDHPPRRGRGGRRRPTAPPSAIRPA